MAKETTGLIFKLIQPVTQCCDFECDTWSGEAHSLVAQCSIFTHYRNW